jgi:glycosyltransferase involved in cell wall biosynthesis
VVLTHEVNQGVGGAVLTGYGKALEDDIDIVVKIDGDGQMDPTLLPAIVAPIISGRADYSKGNRFDTLESLEQMPKVRIFGNAVLSLMSKVSAIGTSPTRPMDTQPFTAASLASCRWRRSTNASSLNQTCSIASR